jgi:hypothetical protein
MSIYGFEIGGEIEVEHQIPPGCHEICGVARNIVVQRRIMFF